MKMIQTLTLSAALTVAVTAPELALAGGDPEAGEKVFRRCMACHSVEPGEHRVGPSLYGVYGREAATAEGFKYSEAMKNHDVTWNAETLDTYLQAPQDVVPGTRMSFPGLDDDDKRRNVIAYLKSLTE